MREEIGAYPAHLFRVLEPMVPGHIFLSRRNIYEATFYPTRFPNPELAAAPDVRHGNAVRAGVSGGDADPHSGGLVPEIRAERRTAGHWRLSVRPGVWRADVFRRVSGGDGHHQRYGVYRIYYESAVLGAVCLRRRRILLPPPHAEERPVGSGGRRAGDDRRDASVELSHHPPLYACAPGNDCRHAVDGIPAL